MDEYCIYVGRDTSSEDVVDDWRDQVGATRGLTVVPTDSRGMIVKCEETIADKLKKKFAFLKIEYVYPYDFFR